MIQLTLTLRTTTLQVDATFVINSPIQDYAHPDEHIPHTYETKKR